MDGRLKAVGKYVDGEFDGDWERWRVSLFKRGPSKNGKQVGLWKRYYENGQLWDEGTYAGGKKVGEWKVRQSWCAQAKESIQGEELRRAGESLGSQPCVPTGHGGPREQVKKR